MKGSPRGDIKQEWIITLEVFDEISDEEEPEELYNESEMNSYIKDDIIKAIENETGLKVLKFKIEKKGITRNANNKRIGGY